MGTLGEEEMGWSEKMVGGDGEVVGGSGRDGMGEE